MNWNVDTVFGIRGDGISRIIEASRRDAKRVMA
jgi:thiamine pyrophosphate-dependent acetolactate synthase large subunit-like protein